MANFIGLESLEKAEERAKHIVTIARNALGADFGGHSVRDLLMDNLPIGSNQIDELLRRLKLKEVI